MNQLDKFNAAIASLHEAALGNTPWRETSTLLDDLCGMKGTHLVIVDGRSKDEPEWLFDEFYYHGDSYEELGREYSTVFFPQDERIPRLMRLPDQRIAHVTDLWTAQELKTSPTYHDLLRRTTGRDGLNIRMDGPNGLDILGRWQTPPSRLAGVPVRSRALNVFSLTSASSSESVRPWLTPKPWGRRSPACSITPWSA